MNWWRYIIPRTVARYSSRYNHDIRIVDEGTLKLLVNGSRQSGSYIEYLWKDALRHFHITRDIPVHSVLVLGVGGGTIIRLLKFLYPHAQITAVDIDETILYIARKHFHLDGIDGVTLVAGDAQKYVAVESRKATSFYDLVIVDIFVGRHIPQFAYSEPFLRDIKKIMRKNSRLIINFLRELEYKEIAPVFVDKLKKIYQSVRSREIKRNIFILAQT